MHETLRDTAPEEPADLQALADRHGFGREAVRHMRHALEAGGGGMAQFDHPEFGGMGQWFSGGMVMLGRMNDHALKVRVSALCLELAATLPGPGRADPEPSQAWSSQSQSSGLTGASASGSAGRQTGGGRWWPDGLGRPASVGAQNATRYAYFPESRRLAVETGGEVALYDTGEHVITGASQQQGGTASFRFTGPNGTVGLDDFRRVGSGEARDGRPPADARSDAAFPGASDRVAAKGRELDPGRFEGVRSGPAHDAGPAPRAAHARPSPSPAVQEARSPSQPASPQPATPQTDILGLLERLADLHRKGVLTDDEFARKKADLLDRL